MTCFLKRNQHSSVLPKVVVHARVPSLPLSAFKCHMFSLFSLSELLQFRSPHLSVSFEKLCLISSFTIKNNDTHYILFQNNIFDWLGKSARSKTETVELIVSLAWKCILVEKNIRLYATWNTWEK